MHVRHLASRLCERHPCSQPGTDPHHIWPKGSNPKLRHVIPNGIALCRKHHDEAGENLRGFRAWFAKTFPARWAALQKAKEAA